MHRSLKEVVRSRRIGCRASPARLAVLLGIFLTISIAVNAMIIVSAAAGHDADANRLSNRRISNGSRNMTNVEMNRQPDRRGNRRRPSGVTLG